ncbi:hypothetical protein PM082_001940 [Marasmius tenuissimus]|nr:hypothetical protein PM082_001940 [Marasmius tenuissimus]
MDRTVTRSREVAISRARAFKARWVSLNRPSPTIRRFSQTKSPHRPANEHELGHAEKLFICVLELDLLRTETEFQPPPGQYSRTIC